MIESARHVILLGVLLFSVGCSSKSAGALGPPSPKSLESTPEVEVRGPRTKANVIANMAPLLRKMQEIYEEHRLRNPDLKGRIDLRLTVEWIGEILEIEIVRSSMSDRTFEEAVLRPIQFMDFDGWSESDEDTEILYPLVFGE
jgi:hypothetical protein